MKKQPLMSLMFIACLSVSTTHFAEVIDIEGTWVCEEEDISIQIDANGIIHLYERDELFGSSENAGVAQEDGVWMFKVQELEGEGDDGIIYVKILDSGDASVWLKGMEEDIILFTQA